VPGPVSAKFDDVYYLAGVNIVNAIFKYRGIDWSALRKLSLTVAFALTIITPDTVVRVLAAYGLSFTSFGIRNRRVHLAVV